MNPARSNAYQIQSMSGGWTRIDMLLALYDRAIVSVRCAQQAKLENQQILFLEKFLDAQKCVLAIHSGLKPDEYELAYEIARLLHFIMTRLCEHEFDEAAYFLEKIRKSFEAIREEATRLENEGQIPPLAFTHDINAMA